MLFTVSLEFLTGAVGGCGCRIELGLLGMCNLCEMMCMWSDDGRNNPREDVAAGNLARRSIQGGSIEIGQVSSGLILSVHSISQLLFCTD